MAFLKKYFKFQKTYEKKYGPNTVVLMEKGKFYELYGYPTFNVTSEEVIESNNKIERIQTGYTGKAEDISKILNMNLGPSGVEMALITKEKPNIVGFPNYTLDKHLPKIMEKYTVIIVDQVKEDGKVIDHQVKYVMSPGTSINEIKNTNYICSIYNTMQKSVLLGKTLKYTTVIFVDVGTGKNFIYDFVNPTELEYNVDESGIKLQRLLTTYNPVEIVVETSTQFEGLKTLVHVRPIDKEYEKIEYQKKFLEKIFCQKDSKDKTVNIIEHLGLDRHSHIVPIYINLLQFVYEHDAQIIKNIDHPKIMNDTDKLLIDSNVITQLNLVSNNNLELYNDARGKFDSLFSVINATKTKMGYRLLYDRLLFPINNVVEITRRLELADIFRKESKTNKSSADKIKDYQEILKGIIDIEKKHRKMNTEKLNPDELANLYYSYSFVLKLLTALQAVESLKVIQSSLVIPKTLIPFDVTILTCDLDSFRKEIKTMFDLDILKQYKLANIEKSFINKGIDSKLDEIDKKIFNINNFFENVAEKISLSINDNKCDLVKFKYTEKEGYYLECTKIRWNVFKALRKTITVKYNNKDIKIDDFETSGLKASVRITSSILEKKSDKLLKLYEEFNEYIKKLYFEKLEYFNNKYSKSLKDIVSLIAEIDVAVSSASIAIKYGYCKPLINDKIILDIKNIRHPILERININSQYIGNDLTLDNNGMVIYGFNSIGKSCLLKAVGLSVVLAQMGMYVPCNEFKYKPFDNILVKIVITDNMFKEKSTFICEMSELKYMIDTCSDKTLILCDELCSSTESLSGTTIMASSINELVKKKCSFMITSHLHGLMDIEDMKKHCEKSSLTADAALRVYHFSVEMKNDKIVYIRKLIPGQGQTLYGLEIAKGLSFDKGFIANAFKYREEITSKGESLKNTMILSTKKSRYNSNVFMDECYRCGSKKQLHTHHISPQKNADSVGFISDIKNNKNVKYNLVVLCEECHVALHQNDETKIKVKK